MKTIFKIILMISIIFFSKEEKTMCMSDNSCTYFNREEKCELEADGVGYCLCMEGYTREDNGNCTKSVSFGESCNLYAELCKDANQECNINQLKCVCKSGYIWSDKAKICKEIIEYGKTCDEDNCESNQICGNDSKCECSEGYTYDETKKICLKKVNYGETCDNKYIICEIDQICEDSKCECFDEYTYDESNKICQKTVNYGDTCDDKYNICEPNLICEDSICVCSEGLIYSYEESKCNEGEDIDVYDSSKFIGFNVLFFYIFLFL